MKPEDQRIAIAEACGWTNLHEGYKGSYNLCDSIRPPSMGDASLLGTRPGGHPTEQGGIVPDYLNDLNAMHAAERVLRDRCLYWPDYIDELLTLCTNAYPHLPNEKLKPNWSATVGATAAQRAEAFLRALGKWTD